MPMVIGLKKRFELLKSQPQLRTRLWEIARALQKGLKERGFDLGVTDTMVTPVFLKGDLYEATALTRDLRETYGVFCSIVIYPVIPKGLILLRLIPAPGLPAGRGPHDEQGCRDDDAGIALEQPLGALGAKFLIDLIEDIDHLVSRSLPTRIRHPAVRRTIAAHMAPGKRRQHSVYRSGPQCPA